MRKGVFYISFLLLAIAPHLFLSGCATQQKAVTFTPVTDVKQEEPDQKSQLKALPVAELLSRGDKYQQQGNIPLAKLHYLEALSKDAELTGAYLHLGQIFLQEKNLQKAKLAFENVYKREPENFIALKGLAMVYRLSEEYHAALTCLAKAEALAPGNPTILTEMAICYDAVGDLGSARDYYLKVARLLPKSASAYNNLGFHYLISEKYEVAVDMLRIASRMSPKDPVIKNNLAAGYILSGKVKRGLAMFENSVGQAEAYNNAGYIQMVQNDLVNAEASFVRAIELNPRYYVKAAENLEYLRTIMDRSGLE